MRIGVLTGGGDCPGLNAVIRSVVRTATTQYGSSVIGFRDGWRGLLEDRTTPLDVAAVDGLLTRGGTTLGSARVAPEKLHAGLADMKAVLASHRVDVLIPIGGEGTLTAAHLLSEAGVPVVGVPKTIDNDISYIQRSFGFETAVSEAKRATIAANSEATGARNGIGLVKLMGRDSGFIAASTVLSDNDVNFCLVPEVPFTLEGFLAALGERLERKGNAVIVAAEGAGQDLIGESGEKDASGNVRYNDIGAFLKERIEGHFGGLGVDITLKYIDPSYIIRGVPANSSDSAFSLLLGHNAVHAGMAGRTDMLVCFWGNEVTHVPIRLAVSDRKRIDPEGWTWTSVLGTTGQPARM